MPIRVTTSGVFFSDAVAKSIVWAVDHGIRVVNLSLGGTELQSPALTRAMAYAAAHDTLLVAAAGNDGDRGDEVSYPAAHARRARRRLEPGALGRRDAAGRPAAVVLDVQQVRLGRGAGRRRGQLPGRRLLDAAERGAAHVRGRPRRTATRCSATPESPVAGRYAYAQGTSFSAPIVSAIASLVLQANPRLHAAQVADVIRRSAHQTVGTGWNPHTGAGVVDALAAVTLARHYDTVAPALSFGVVRTGASLATTLTSVDATGPGELPAGPGPETVSVSTDDKTFRAVASPTPTAPQSRRAHPAGRPHLDPRHRLRRAAQLHEPGRRGRSRACRAPAPTRAPRALGLPGQGLPPARAARLRSQNSYTARVRLEAWDGDGYRLFQTLRLPFGKAVTAREHVPYTGPLRLRARLVAGPLWQAASSSLVVRVR